MATQALRLPNAMPVGPLPTAIDCTSPVSGSMRATRLAVLWLAQSVPAPKASSVAATFRVLVGRPLSGSILVIVSSPVFATQIEPLA